MQSKMAAVGSETAQGLQQLFIDISLKFSSVESENVVKILKNNYGGQLLGNRDLLESLHLLKKHGYVSENNLKLIEDVIASKSNNEEIIKKFIEHFKASRSVTADPEKELRLNFRIPRNFGPPHLHVSGGFEDRGITQ